jgi:hypothetical protein
MDESRSGFVVALVVVAIVALGLLLHGALVLARSEHQVARAGEALLQARGQARLGLHRLGAAVSSSTEAGGRGVAGAGPGGSHRASLVRLDREWWLAEAVGRDPAGRVSRRLVRPLWILDPVARAADPGAAVEVGPGAPITILGGVAGAGPTAEGEELRRLCRPWERALDSLGAASVPRAGLGTDGWEGGELGLLTLEDLLARIPVEVVGPGTPEPLARGERCGEGAWRWGDPGAGSGPCADRWVARRAPGDLVMEGGVGQGLLAVEGDLTVASGAHFRGLVLVGGALVLRDGALLEGMARARGGVAVDATSRVRGSRCPPLRALAQAAPVLSGPVRPAGGAWAPGDGS